VITFSIFRAGNRFRHLLYSSPVSFGTAKVRTFFVTANFNFIYSFANKPANSFAGCKGTQIIDAIKPLLQKTTKCIYNTLLMRMKIFKIAYKDGCSRTTRACT